jgi:phosphate transport system permease protein
MPDVLTPELAPATPSSLQRSSLPTWAPILVGVVALAAAGLFVAAIGGGPAGIVVIATILFAVALPTWSRVVEGQRKAADRLVTTLIWVALGLALIPLVSLLWQVVSVGGPELNVKFLTWSMRNVVGAPGGIYHAIIGTLLITATAAVISIPVGLLTAIYLVEYGGNGGLSRGLRFLIDVMTGIPSIVAGLFAYTLFRIIFGPGTQIGFGGGVALSILMIPIVVRSAEEMLKLVPSDLREASYALGVPKWKTIVKVVLPTAAAGIVTGITLAIARVIGETAPLIIICGVTDSVNTNLFHGQMESLPVFIYLSYTQPGLNPDIRQNMAWGAALVLVIIVAALNLVARLAGRLLAPKTGR